MEKIPRERLHIVTLEDVAKDPAHEYQLVCEYLGVDKSELVEFSVKNKAKVKINPWLHQVLRGLGRAKMKIGINHGFGFLNTVARLNTKEPEELSIDDDVSYELAHIFNSEIDKIEKLVGRDFSAWKR